MVSKTTTPTTTAKKTVEVGAGVEGGPYSCTAGACADNPFTTTNRAEFDKHISESVHYSQGVAPCAICGEEVDMNVVLTRAGRKPIHNECREPPEEL